MRALVFTNTPRPYRHALFNEVVRAMGSDEQLHVAYTSSQSAHQQKSVISAAAEEPTYSSSALPAVSMRLGPDTVLSLPSSVRRLVRSYQPHVAVVGGFGVDALAVQLVCRSLGVPVVVWSGAWPGGERTISDMREFERRRLIKNAAAVCYGSLSRDYVVRLGADSARVIVATNTVDIERFRHLAAEARGDRGLLGRRFRLAEVNLVYVGQLIARKGVAELLRATCSVASPRGSWRLHIVGSGPLKQDLERLASRYGLGDAVRFHGFLKEEDVGSLVALSDALVLPSLREIWGLVVNEALACGVPVVASSHAGATHDLVHDGINGFVVDPSNSAQFGRQLERIIEQADLRRAMSESASRLITEEAGLPRSAAAFVEALRLAAAVQPAARS